MELISDFDTPDPLTEFTMLRRLVERSGRPLSLSLAQAGSSSDGWRGLLGLIEQASRDGLPIRGQVAPRPIGLLLGLQGTINCFSAHEAFAKIKDKKLAEKVRIMRDPSFRAALLAETEGRQSHPLARRVMAFGPHLPARRSAELRAAAGDLARRHRRAPGPPGTGAGLRPAAGGRGPCVPLLPFANYTDFNLDACHDMIAHPDCVQGLGDGGAHVGIISDASFATYLLTHWGRDRSHGRFDLSYW